MDKNYINLSRQLHKSSDSFGIASAYDNVRTLKGILQLPAALISTAASYTINNVLDFGTGQGGLITSMKKEVELKNIKFVGYDPAVKAYQSKPTSSFDIVTCIDVLEHISREDIMNILQDINSHTNGFFFFAIDLMPAKKILSDGRNAHILLAPADWWTQQISSIFSFTRFLQVGHTVNHEKHPIHLFGWATNDYKYQNCANHFLDHIKILEKKWIYKKEGGSVNFAEY